MIHSTRKKCTYTTKTNHLSSKIEERVAGTNWGSNYVLKGQIAESQGGSP
jgi:hypothetical protein